MPTATRPPDAPPLDGLDLAAGMHAFATGILRIVESYAVVVLPFVLANVPKMTRAEKREAVARLKAMMPAEAFDAILAYHERR